MISFSKNMSMKYTKQFFNSKKLAVIFGAVMIILNSFTLAQIPDELMKEGNKYFQEKDYTSAIDAYHKILSQGIQSAPLYYNLGNAYFKSGRIGHAILNYEKGLKLSPGDEDLAYNLQIANSRTVDKITELPSIFIVKWWEILITSFSFTGWSIITIFLYILFLTSIGLYLLSKNFNVQRISFFSGSISLSVLIVATVILISRYNHEASTDYGILLNPIYSVKTSPDIKSNDAFVIHEGIKFVVEDNVNEWVKIKLVDGKIGWIEKRAFEQI